MYYYIGLNIITLHHIFLGSLVEVPSLLPETLDPPKYRSYQITIFAMIDLRVFFVDAEESS